MLANRFPAVARVLSRRGHVQRVAFYRQFVRPDDLVFDVGAHIGNRTRVFRELGARVIAVEPQESCLRQLHRQWDSDPEVVIIPMGVSDAPGEAQMHVGSASTVSTLSTEWQEVAKTSGRFDAISWAPGPRVPLTTLGALVEEYGVPAFCKIDVEGFESRVLAGLDRPIGTVSIEWVPEYEQNTDASLDRLAELGAHEFNLSIGDTYAMDLPQWTDVETLRAHLRSYRGTSSFGDVYARS